MKRFGTSIKTKWAMRAAIALVAGSAGATWCLVAMSNAGPLTNATRNVTVPDMPADTPYVDITSAGPLTDI